MAFQNPEFWILAEFNILAFQNPQFKIFADFKILAFQMSGVEADHGGRVSIALLKLLLVGPEYGHFSQNNNSVMPKNKPKISCEALKERKMKRTREGSSQTDEDVFEDDSHGCPKCKSTKARLAEIDEKLERLLKLTDEFETYKSRVKSLEDEQKSMQESLGSSQTEIKEMQGLQDNIAEQQKTTEASLQRVQCGLAELQRRHIKLECHSRRGNLKFYGIKEREHESNEDTEDLLRNFLRTDLKIPKEDEESIQFDRVHRVSTRRVSSGTPNSKPRPIIVKLSSYHDKEFIKSFIKNLTKGRNLGISDDFPKEVEEMRKKLYPVLKAAKQEKRTAFFKVERLIIDGSL